MSNNIGYETTNFDGSILINADQSQTVKPTANEWPTFASMSVQGYTNSTTTREFLGHFGLVSNKGSTVAAAPAAGQYNRDKVALYAGIQAQSGTGDVWAFNPVTLMDSGSGTYNSYIIEADLNNNVAHRGDTPGAAGLAAPVTYGIAVTGAGTNRSTSGLLVTGLSPTSAPIWNRGLTFALDSIVQSTIADYTSSSISLDIQGQHKVGFSYTGSLLADVSNNAYTIIAQPTVLATNVSSSFYSSPQTGPSGAYAAMYHFSANNAAKNGTSTVTSQYGFITSDLTSAPTGSNFGFYSGVNGSNWAFYAAGTAASYFGGGILTTTLTNSGSTVLGDSQSADQHIINGALNLVVNSTAPGLNITQSGTGLQLNVNGDATFNGKTVIKPSASATPTGFGDMMFQLTNDTTLVIKVKGIDGVTRSTTLTLA